MVIFNSFNKNKDVILNILFSLIPLSFLIGNFVINLNVLFIIVFTFLIYNKKIFGIKLLFIDKVIISFFIFIFISGITNNTFFTPNVGSDDYMILIKTISYIRYLLLYFVLRFLVEENKINFKWFFISCFIFSLFVSLDIFYQFIFAKDIFGFEMVNSRKLSGPFGEELIAGGYLQRFSIFGFFIFPFFFKIKKTYLSLILVTLFLIYTASIILSGNRIPAVLYLMTLFLILLFEKRTRKYFPIFLILTSFVFYPLYVTNHNIKSNFGNLVNVSSRIVKVFIADNFSKTSKVCVRRDMSAQYTSKVCARDMPAQYREFKTFYGTWLMNKYIGGGIRSFRYNCPQRKIIKDNERATCNTHPHNYYLEILTDLGLIGLILSFTIFIIIIYNSLIKKYFLKSDLSSNELIIPFIFIFIPEIFPLRTSGSFFSTANSTYIFLLISIIVALSNKKT
jgi:O-antigen ligase